MPSWGTWLIIFIHQNHGWIQTYQRSPSHLTEDWNVQRHNSLRQLRCRFPPTLHLSDVIYFSVHLGHLLSVFDPSCVNFPCNYHCLVFQFAHLASHWVIFVVTCLFWPFWSVCGSVGCFASVSGFSIFCAVVILYRCVAISCPTGQTLQVFIVILCYILADSPYTFVASLSPCRHLYIFLYDFFWDSVCACFSIFFYGA